MIKQDNSWFKLLSELQAIAQNGLTYTENAFDRERYVRLREIAAELIANHSEKSREEIAFIFSNEQGYATPKVDVRAFVLQNEKLLLVKERSDGLWTLPGGWADINQSPSEAAIRETKEESGYDVAVVRLLALWDKQKHDHPLQWPHIYKCFFHCEIIGGEQEENLEIEEIGFFDIKQLPPLSTDRVTQNQILHLHKLVFTTDRTVFD